MIKKYIIFALIASALLIGYVFILNGFYPNSMPSIYNIAKSFMPLFNRYGLQFETALTDIQELINSIVKFARIKNLGDIFNILSSIFKLIQPIISLLILPIRFAFDFIVTTFGIISSGSGVRDICQYWNGFNC